MTRSVRIGGHIARSCIALLLACCSLWAQAADMRIQCSGRVAPQWSQNLRDSLPCIEPGKAYREDRITFEGSGFPAERGSVLKDFFWYHENGAFAGLSGILNPFDDFSIKPDGTVAAALLVPTTIKPGRYKLLFYGLTPCHRTLAAECNTPRPAALPGDFGEPPGVEMVVRQSRPPVVGQPDGLDYVFAVAELEILDGKHPEPNTDSIRLTCEDSPCREGARFYFTTGGPYRHLVEGGYMGCVRFRKSGADPRPFGNTVEQMIIGDQGMRARVKNGGLSGWGDMPEAGRWDATFECMIGGVSVPLGEFTVVKKTEPPPSNVMKLNRLALRITEKQTGVAGAQLAPDQLARGTRFTLEMTGLAWSGGESYVAELGGVSLGERFSFYACPLACDDDEKNRKNSGQPRLRTRSFTVPAQTPVGAQQLVVRCSDCTPATSSDDYRGELAVTLLAQPNMPALELPASARPGDTITVRGRGFVPASEVGRVTISGVQLFPPAGRQSGLRIGADGAFALQLALPYEVNRAFSGDNTVDDLDVSAWINPADKNDRPYTVERRMSIRKTCEQAAVARLMADNALLDLDKTEGVAIAGEGFGCSVRAQIRVLHGETGKLVDGPFSERTDIRGAFKATIWGSPEYAKDTPSLVVEAESAPQNKASVRITVKPPAPKFTIAVEPERLQAGQRITVRWKGFPSNVGAVLYLDDRVLKDAILLDRSEPAISARLPDNVSGKRRLRLSDARDNTALTELNIERAETEPDKPVSNDVCDKPCVLAPASEMQGRTIPIRISGFPRNSQVRIGMSRLGDLKALYQSGPVDTLDFKLLETLPDGSYTITARSVATPDVMAETTIRIAGARRPLKLRALPLDPRDGEAIVIAGTQSVHVSGEGWWPKGSYSARLVGQSADAAASIALGSYTSGCQWMIGAPQQTPSGQPCDESKGELDQHWPVGANAGAGLYRLELSDGVNTAATENLVRVTSTKPAPPEAPTCNPDMPKVRQPGCIDKPVPPSPDKPKACNPDLPRMWQPGCVDKPMPTPPTPPDGKKVCNPDMPRIWQPGCIDDAKGGDRKQEPSLPCDPTVPRYAQPGCAEGAPAQPVRTLPQPAPVKPTPPSPDAGQKCNPNIPAYAQPGCVP